MTQQEFQHRYKIIDRLGEGGFGEVFKAYDTVRDRWVALKVSKVKPELESVRLSKEVELINRLPEHPNIAFYEACFTFHEMIGEYDYGLLQYYEEGNLLQLLSREAPPQPSPIWREILTQILDGLEFLHEQGIIHRDLKPQNILIVRRHNGEYVPKITDFGISKEFDATHSSVFSNSLAGAGTLAYSSPEQLADRDIRKNADLWSFGVIAFRVLTGQLPFTTGEHAPTSEDGRQELFHQIKSGNLPDIIKQIPEPWQTLIRRCLIKDPANRIKNVQEAKAILEGKEVAGYVSTKTDDYTKIDRGSPVFPKSQNSAGRDVAGYVSTKTDDHTIIDRSPAPVTPISPKSMKSPDHIAYNLNLQMIAVRGGTFTMGGTSEQGKDCFDREKPAHRVTLNDYYIGKYEVTQMQWRSVMGTTVSQQRDKANTALALAGEGDNYPMYYVSWYEAMEFIRRLNAQTGKKYRLPTEAEWEFAARGGNNSRGYKYSGSNSAGNVAWFYENAGDRILDDNTWNNDKLVSNNNKTHPVGAKSTNELGIYDMSGNVWEWCNDWYGDYNSDAQTNPQGPSFGSLRVFRGGSWNRLARLVRVSIRDYGTPDYRGNNLGFRLACSSK